MPAQQRLGTVCESEAHGPGLWDLAGKHPGPGFRWTVLQRHGKRPLAILGRVLLQANNRCAGLPSWSELTIYETAGSRFAATLRHTPPEAGSPAWCDAWSGDDAEAIRSILAAHDPLRALPHVAMQAVAVPFAASACEALSRDAMAAQRFRGAWAALLAAVFGITPTRRIATCR